MIVTNKSILNINKLDVLIVVLMFLLLPVDMINGFLLKNNINLPISVAQFYKFVILVCIFFTFLRKPDNLILSVGIFSLLLLSSLYQIIQFSEFSILLGDIVKIFRYLAPLFCFLYFVNVIKRNHPKTISLLLKLVYFSYAVLSFNVFIKYLGYGYPMYEFGNIGSKGFFHAGNEISALLIILSSIIGFDLWFKEQKLKYILFLLFSLAVGLGISSKTAALGVLFVFMLIPLKGITIKSKISKILAAVVVISLALPILIFYSWEYIKTSELYIRLVFFYDKSDFLTFMFSNRNVFFIDAYKTYIQEYNIIEKIIGVGQTHYEVLNEDKIVEIDFIDIFFAYGIMGLSLFLLIISFLWIQLKRLSKSKNYPYANFVFLMFIILLGISSTAGHVFSSGMAAFFIGLLLSLMYIKKNEDITA